MFFASMWLVMTIAGAFQLGNGSVATVSTKLTADLTSAATTLHVKSTSGFASVGELYLGAEKVRYTTKTSTTFAGIAAQPLQRGWDGTTATTHSAGAGVRSPEAGIINNAMDTKIANISDSAGVMKFFAIADAAVTLLATFFTSPFTLPADLAILTLLWVMMGVLFFVFLSLTYIGGRRV